MSLELVLQSVLAATAIGGVGLVITKVPMPEKYPLIIWVTIVLPPRPYVWSFVSYAGLLPFMLT
jgi:hypothetical protein